MKNNSFSYVLTSVSGLMLLLASCEKVSLGESAAGKEEANVVVSVRSYEMTPFGAKTRTAISDLCNRLSFVAFNTRGERFDQKNQLLGDDDDFGEAYFTLPVGTYRMAVVAHSSDGNPTVSKRTESKNESISFTNAKGFTDTFFASQPLTVGEEPVNLTMNLSRVVAMIRFVNTDAIPANADSVRFYYEGGSGSLDVVTSYGNVNSKQTMWFDKAATPYEIYTIPHTENDEIDVTIGTYRGTDLVTSKEIPGIPIRRNCITTCTGRLFDGKVSKVTFTITVNPTWGTPINYPIPNTL